EIVLDTQGESINAGHIGLQFSNDILEVEDFISSGGIFTLYVQNPGFDNEQGTMLLEGGVPNGFVGKGVLGRIFFRAKAEGQGEVSFLSPSRIYLNDGSATLAKISFGKGQYQITRVAQGYDLPVLYSSDHPRENIWYPSPAIRMSWDIKEGARYSYVLSKDPSEIPDEIPDQPIGQVKLDVEGDGAFYFHLRECRDGQCGPTVTRVALKDQTPPDPFGIGLGQGEILFEGKKFLSFLAHDETSGIAFYEVSEQAGIWKPVQSPYVLQNQAFRGMLKVRAVDKAGNERVSSLPMGQVGIPYEIAVLLAILGLYFIAAFLLAKHHKKLSMHE
ncbi:MAG: hypothetical protein HYT50_02210, partial [Candidatus Wildermuthbacteria bacterium]|nr:hypothetical protein [Candidatus Wildermuthbacteria bacterium]